MENSRNNLCGCGGSGKPAGTRVNNKPLFELRHLIAMLERQEAEAARRRNLLNSPGEEFSPPDLRHITTTDLVQGAPIQPGGGRDYYRSPKKG
jgi:hypothetical protein